MTEANGPAGAAPGIGHRMLRRVIDVRPEEVGVLFWCWLYIFAVLSSYYIMRPIRDEIGVAGGVNNLQWLFTGTLLGMVVLNLPFAYLVKTLPRRSIAGPGRAEDGVPGGIDEIRRAQCRPPRRARIIARSFAVAKRKRRCGDAADDQDRGRRAELWAVHPAAKLHRVQLPALDGEPGMLNDQPPRPQAGGGKRRHLGIV